MATRWCVAAVAVLISAACSGPTTLPGPSVTPSVLVTGSSAVVVLDGSGLLKPGSGGSTTVTARIIAQRALDGAAVPGTAFDVPASVSPDPNELQRVALRVAAPEPGVYALEVSLNEGPPTRIDDALLILARPIVTAQEKAYACQGTTGGGPALSVAGTDLPVIDGVKPYGTYERQGTRTLELAPEACRKVPFSRADVRLCGRLTARAPADLPGGSHEVLVHYPAPLETLTGSAGTLSIIGPPTMPYEDAWRPKQVATTVEAHFVRDDAVQPTATLAGRPLPLRNLSCTPGPVDGLSNCGFVEFVIPDEVAPGTRPFTLRATPACAAGSRQLGVVEFPAIIGFEPAILCSGDPLIIRTKGVVQPSLLVGGGFFVEATCATQGFLTCTDVLAGYTFPMNSPATEVVVMSQTAPITYSAPVQLQVRDRMLVGQPVPRIMTSLSERRVAIVTEQVTGAVTATRLRSGAAGAGSPVAFSTTPTGVEVVIPTGMPARTYTVIITDEGICQSGSAQLTVQADPAVMSYDFENPELSLPTVRRRPLGDATLFLPPNPTYAPGEGSPGAAVHAGEATTTAPWYFSLEPLEGLSGADLALVRFDLRVQASGAPLPTPQVSVFMAGPQGVGEYERQLDPPPGPAWTHYELRLDDPAGWIARNEAGTHPATAEELRADATGVFFAVQILGSWSEGPNEAWLDNFVLELAR